MNPHFPIISLEVQGMKHSIKTALMNELAAIDEGIQSALEEMCEEGNIARIVNAEAKRQIEGALKEEVSNFFRWSAPGRAAVREAVIEYLNNMYPAADKE